MHNLDKFQYIKKNLKISFFCYLTIVGFLIGVYFQIVAFKSFSEVHVKEFSESKKIKLLIFMGVFYLSIFLNFLIISKINNYLYFEKGKIEEELNKLKEYLSSTYINEKNRIESNINITKQKLDENSNIISGLSEEIKLLESNQIKNDVYSKYLESLENIDNTIGKIKEKVDLSRLNSSILEDNHNSLEKYKKDNENKIINLRKFDIFENAKNSILNSLLEIINKKSRFTIIKIDTNNFDISINNKANKAYYELDDKEKSLINMELSILFQKFNKSHFPIIFFDGNISSNDKKNILQPFESENFLQTFWLNVFNINEKIKNLKEWNSKKNELNTQILNIENDMKNSFKEKKQNLEMDVKHLSEKLEQLNNEINDKNNEILRLKNAVLTNESIDKFNSEKINISNDIETTKAKIQSSKTNIISISKCKQELQDFENKNKDNLFKRKQILLLNQMWNESLKEIIQFVNSKTKRAKVEIIDISSTNTKFENYFVIKSKITDKSFYGMNNAERWMVGFELSNLFQDFNQSYFPIIFDNAEMLDKNNQKNIIDNFFKNNINNQNIHQLFLLNVTNGILNINKGNYLTDKNLIK